MLIQEFHHKSLVLELDKSRRKMVMASVIALLLYFT